MWLAAKFQIHYFSPSTPRSQLLRASLSAFSGERTTHACWCHSPMWAQPASYPLSYGSYPRGETSRLRVDTRVRVKVTRHQTIASGRAKGQTEQRHEGTLNGILWCCYQPCPQRGCWTCQLRTVNWPKKRPEDRGTREASEVLVMLFLELGACLHRCVQFVQCDHLYGSAVSAFIYVHCVLVKILKRDPALLIEKRP